MGARATSGASQVVCVCVCVCEGDCVHDDIVLLFLNKLWSENLKDGKWEMGVARQARDN